MIETLLNSPKPRFYMANPGNLGDALIRQGTLKLFEEIELEYTEVKQPPVQAVSTFIFGGGGAWCKNWKHEKFVRNGTFSTFTVVLPSTYAMRSPAYRYHWIKFFTRDDSLSYLFCPRARFHHDLAFMLEKSLMPKKGSGVGYFFRTDKESARTAPLPEGNVDISLWGETYDDTQPFVDAVNAVREVHTDRLHVAIVACMLEKRVNFYPGNYWKNESVYNASMKGRYDVTFREHDR